jgi:hypothetical protein
MARWPEPKPPGPNRLRDLHVHILVEWCDPFVTEIDEIQHAGLASA